MGGGSGGGRGSATSDGIGTAAGDNTHAGFFVAGTNAVRTTEDHAGCTRYLVGPQFDSAITRPLHETAAHS